MSKKAVLHFQNILIEEQDVSSEPRKSTELGQMGEQVKANRHNSWGTGSY